MSWSTSSSTCAWMAGHPGLLDDLQAGREAGHRRQRRQAQLVATGVRVEEHVLLVVRVEPGMGVADLWRAGSRQQRLRDVEVADAGWSQQPLHGRAGRQVDAVRDQVERHDAGRLGDVGDEDGTRGVGDSRQRPQVVAQAGLRGDVRHGHGHRPLVQARRHVLRGRTEARTTAGRPAHLEARRGRAGARDTGRRGRSWRRRRRWRRAAGPGAPPPGCRRVTCRR